jgi:hypothetical protein
VLIAEVAQKVQQKRGLGGIADWLGGGGIGFDWVRFARAGGSRLLHNVFGGKGIGSFSALGKLGSIGFDWVCFFELTWRGLFS